MAEISNVSRIAKHQGPVSWKACILAIRATTGDVTSITHRSDLDRLNKQIDSISNMYSDDDTLLARKPPMKAGVHLYTVHACLSAMIAAAELPDAATPANTDEDVVSYAVRLLLIPTWERMGFLAAGGNAVIMSNEDRARTTFRDFVTTHGGGVQTTELTRMTLMQALDPVDAVLGSLPIDMSLGLRRACVAGAKEMTALEPQLTVSIRNRQAIPPRYQAGPIATKYTVTTLLRMLAPMVAHRLKATNLFCSVTSVHDVCLANDPAAPIVIVIEEKRELRDAPADRDNRGAKRSK